MPLAIEPAAVAAPAEPPLTTSPAVTVLIADDNIDSAEMLSTFVGLKGATAHIAHDGAEAVRLGAAIRPDLILLDIGMPGMDGYEACRQLRANPESAGAYIVALTGWGQDQDKQRARDSGFDAHLTKPADLTAVEKMLATIASRPR
jgi:CheY-like chemotaxis protein